MFVHFRRRVGGHTSFFFEGYDWIIWSWIIVLDFTVHFGHSFRRNFPNAPKCLIYLRTGKEYTSYFGDIKVHHIPKNLGPLLFGLPYIGSILGIFTHFRLRILTPYVAKKNHTTILESPDCSLSRSL